MSEITLMLRDLAAQLGVTVDYLWPLLVKRVLVWWYSQVIAVGLLSLSSITFWMIGMYGDRKDWDSDGVGLIYAVSIILLGLAVIMGLVTIGNLDYLLTPEAVAIDRIIGQIG
jgi:hypothetical protein